MSFHWPQWVWLCIALFSLGIEAAKHGDPKRGHHSFWQALLSLALGGGLLYAGGFFG